MNNEKLPKSIQCVDGLFRRAFRREQAGVQQTPEQAGAVSEMPPAKENNCAMCDWREMARRYEMAWNAKGEEVERLKKQLEIQKKKTELFRELSTIAEQTLHDQEQIFSKSQQIVSEDNKKDAYIKNLIDRIAEKDKLTAMLERQLAGAKAEKDTTWKPPAMDSRKRGRPKKAKTGKVDEHGINTDKYEKL